MEVIKLLKYYYLYQKLSVSLTCIFPSYCIDDVQALLKNSELLIEQNT